MAFDLPPSLLPGVLEQLQEALHQRPHIPCPMGTPGSSRLLLVLVMQFLPHTCHSLILIHLTRLSVQEEETVLLLGPLDLVASLFCLGTGYWVSVSCFRNPQMGPLVGYWLIVKLDAVPGTMGRGCCSQPISGSLGSVPQAGCVDPLPGSSPGGSP